MLAKHGLSSSHPGCPTHQTFVDVDWLLKDCPHDCFVAVGGGQGAHVPVELREVYISNQVVDRDVMVYINISACEKKMQETNKKEAVIKWKTCGFKMHKNSVLGLGPLSAKE